MVLKKVFAVHTGTPVRPWSPCSPVLPSSPWERSKQSGQTKFCTQRMPSPRVAKQWGFQWQGYIWLRYSVNTNPIHQPNWWFWKTARIKCILDDDLKVAPPKIEVLLLMWGNITQTEDTLCSHFGLRQEREERNMRKIRIATSPPASPLLPRSPRAPFLP